VPVVDPKIAASVIFVLCYAAIVRFKSWKSHVLWAGIGAGIILGLISTRNIFEDVNWNVMGIFAGTLVLADFFIVSRVPEAIASFLVRRSSNVGSAFLSVCLFASFLSVFIENVAVVLIVAPIAIELARKIDVSPVPVMIGIAIASNLQGTATLIGDPPSMILANFQKMNFNDFFVYHGKPGIFFAVEAGAVGSLGILFLIFKKYRKRLDFAGRAEVESFIPAAFLVIMVAGLAAASLVDPDFRWFGGAVCMVLAVVILLTPCADRNEKRSVMRRFDWGTTAFLAGVFVMVGMLERAGVIERVAAFLGAHLGGNPAVAFAVIVWGSVIFSAFIDNVPYITTMIPVVQKLSASMNLAPELLLFGLLIGACLGGNITPVGASANVVATGILKKNGHVISFGEFMKIGVPFTIVATAIGMAFIYAVWH
jgi:Na+/H+ antiporter NhaD/arsenite permease-like protein